MRGGQVEWLTLDDIFDIKNGYTPSKKNSEYWEGGNIPWFRMEDIRQNGRILNDSIQHVTNLGVKSSGLFKRGSIMVATTATIGEHALIETDYLSNQQLTNLTIKDKYAELILPKYAFYYFFIVDRQCLGVANFSGGIPIVDQSRFKKLRFAVPPLKVQERIVYVLDNFDAVCNDLNIGLPAEIEARQKQYEYYRDRLLSFDAAISDGIERERERGVAKLRQYIFGYASVRLNDVILSLNTGLNHRSFFRLNTDDATNYYITIREIHDGNIIPTDKTDRMNNEALRLCNNRSSLEAGDVLFSGTGTIGETAVITAMPKDWNIKEGVYTIKPDQEFIIPMFLRYALMSKDIIKEYEKKIVGGTIKSIPMKELKNISICIPTLEKQQEIIDLVDRFNTLCNDIKSGLPAEIKARHKQYEYYRDKLLTFSEK